MKLEPIPSAIGAAVAFAVIWVLCSAFVAISPAASNAAFSGMMHAAMPMMYITPGGFMIGLVGWALSAGITALVLAIVYNVAIGRKPAA